MSEASVVEPGGWLAERQRARCTGNTAMTTFQGLIADEFILPQGAANHPDPARLVQASVMWTEALMDQGYFIPGEFSVEAAYAFFAQDYVTQARMNGHAGYFASRGQDEIALACARAGLKSMLADPHMELFDLMIRLNRAAPTDARKHALKHGYRNTAAALRDLDPRLAALEQKEPLAPRQKTWLKSLRKLKLVPDNEFNAHLNRVARANALFAERKTEVEAERAARERDDPGFRLAQSLCTEAGLRFRDAKAAGFTQVRSVWPRGPARPAYALRVETQQGLYAVLLYAETMFAARRSAVLVEQGGEAPLAQVRLTRGEYAQIAGPAARG